MPLWFSSQGICKQKSDTIFSTKKKEADAFGFSKNLPTAISPLR
jgi:hypothetical protein